MNEKQIHIRKVEKDHIEKLITMSTLLLNCGLNTQEQ
jgi:hypothetical protein